MVIKVAKKPAVSFLDEYPPSPTPELMAYAEKVGALKSLVPSVPQTIRRGRPHSGKVVVSLRLEPEVIEKFRATGPGWQARINDALKRAKV